METTNLEMDLMRELEKRNKLERKVKKQIRLIGRYMEETDIDPFAVINGISSIYYP